MVMTPLLLGTQTYMSREEAAQGQRLVNLYVEPLPKDSAYPFLLPRRHGLNLQLDFEYDNPVRGMREFNGNLFIVMGTRLYKVDALYNFIHVNSATPIINNNRPVFMEDNGFEMAILTTSGQYYTIDSSDILTQQAFDFGATSLTYAYQRMIASTYNSSNQALLRVGDLVDATTFDPLLVAGVTEVSDLIVRVFAYSNMLYVMKQTSIEYFTVTDDATLPFQQIPASTKTYLGLAGSFAVTGNDKYIFWLGNDGKIYQGQSFDYAPISTPAIEYIIEGFTSKESCYAYSFTEAGHKFVAFDFPDDDRTFIYDIEVKLWHERSTFGVNRWEVISPVLFGGKLLFGSSATGKLYELSQDAVSDNGVHIAAECRTPPIGDGTTRLFFNRLQLTTKRGVGNVTGEDTDPQIILQYTDDGGRTYSNEQWRSLGGNGHYEGRCLWHKQGASRGRSYRIRVTAKVRIVITGFFGDIEKGVS